MAYFRKLPSGKALGSAETRQGWALVHRHSSEQGRAISEGSESVRDRRDDVS